MLFVICRLGGVGWNWAGRRGSGGEVPSLVKKEILGHIVVIGFQH
jgi:hypothetical protein